MNARLLCVAALFVSACTKQVDVSAIEAGKDYSGLSENERKQFEWAAVDVDIPADVVSSLRRWELSNVSLYLFKCEEPADYFPADARMAGKAFRYQDLNPARPARLTFYVSKAVQERERYACAAFDARGYSPVFLHGRTVRLPQLRFESAVSS